MKNRAKQIINAVITLRELSLNVPKFIRIQKWSGIVIVEHRANAFR
jgi:hypothetical protein